MTLRSAVIAICGSVLGACAATGDPGSKRAPGAQQSAPQSSEPRDLAALALAAQRLQKETDGRNRRLAQYEEDWRIRVEKIGAETYPSNPRGLSGSLRLTVAIRSDGTVESIVINRSSGHTALDQAAADIVRSASPFQPFQPDLAKDVDKLVITRTWFFGSQAGVDVK